jgi:hypothetical protein
MIGKGGQICCGFFEGDLSLRGNCRGRCRAVVMHAKMSRRILPRFHIGLNTTPLEMLFGRQQRQVNYHLNMAKYGFFHLSQLRNKDVCVASFLQ